MTYITDNYQLFFKGQGRRVLAFEFLGGKLSQKYLEYHSPPHQLSLIILG